MIIERRRYIRDPEPVKFDSFDSIVNFDFCGSYEWDDDLVSEVETTPLLNVVVIALLTGLFTYLISNGILYAIY